MALKLTNNATSLLATTIDAVVTNLTLTGGDEGKFPVLGVGDWCPIVVVDAAANREIMRCTARAGVNLTVVRGQEGTAARGFTAGARVDVRLTTQAINEMNADATLLTTGIISDAVLPVRLRPALQPVPGAGSGDCNSVTVSGHYFTVIGTLNQPVGEAGYLWVDVYNSTFQYQEWQDIDTSARYSRLQVASVWGAWTRIFSGVPSGTIIDYAGSYGGAPAPTGWLFCYGQGVLRSTYPTLDAAIYVGDANNALAAVYHGFRANQAAAPFTRSTAGLYIVLPDMRGRVAAGKDDMGGGVGANRLTGQYSGFNGDLLGNAGGVEDHQLTDAQLAAHWHPLGTLAIGSAGAHQHGISGGHQIPSQAGWDYRDTGGSTGILSQSAGAHTHPITGVMAPIGADQPHTNMQPTIIMQKLIKT